MEKFALQTLKLIENEKKRLEEYKLNLLKECLKQREIKLKFPYKKRHSENIELNWKIEPYLNKKPWVNLK